MKTILLQKRHIHTGSLILVNRDYGYHTEENTSLIPVQEHTPDILIQRRAGILLSSLMEQINGWQHIVPVSGWRSLAKQQTIWDDSLSENGLPFTSTYVAVPGHSEHQTGLAIDLGLRQKEIDFIRPAFPYDGICGLFRKRAADYGFIERYPAGKETITGIGHEPWHFRYVGIPHAAIITEHQLTLEEYLFFIRQFRHGRASYHFRRNSQEISVSWLEADGNGCGEACLDTELPYSISGNNFDGFIITEWRQCDAYQKELRRASSENRSVPQPGMA
ncbi:MAG TPA: peptidase M15 [Lachnospiraceae bacterium]|nr:peptidase M15 [Lachnospiraceae bacterium]